MQLITKPDYQSMSKWAADHVVEKINQAQPTPENPFVLGLPTGSTPLGMYQALIEHYKSGKVSFKNVITFNMDEYVNLPKEHPESYYSFMWNNFFHHIDIQKENAHILNGNAADLQAECDNYEAAIKAVGGIHLFIGGVGVNGHIAFNEPGTPFTSRTGIQTLTQETIDSNARFFDNDISLVPKSALSVGIATITDASEVMILINGKNKAQALFQAVKGDVSEEWPITVLQNHAQAIIVCDEAAAF